MMARLYSVREMPWRRYALAPTLTVLTLLTALSLWSLPGQAEEALLGRNVDDLLRYAREHNPDLRSRQLDAEALRERIEPASALPDPKFQVELMDFTNAMTPGKSTSLAPGDVGTTRYRAIQSLPFPGKRGLKGEIAEAQAGQSDTLRDSTRLEVDAQIRTAYARYFLAAGQARIQRETLQLIQALKHLVLQRYSVGIAPQQDAVQVQGESTRLKVDLLDSERNRREAAALLNALLPRAADAPLAEPAALPPIPKPPSLSQLFERARNASPDMGREQLGITAAEKNRDLTYLNRYPDFTLALTNNRPRSASIGPDTWDFMVEVNIPLQQSSRRAQEREAERRLESARERVSAAESRLNGQLGITLAALEASLDKARLLRETLLPQARATLDAAQAGYESGRVNFNTLIDAERQILRTRLALLDAEVDASVRHAALEKLLGAPL